MAPTCRARLAPAVGAVAQLGERLVRNEEVGGSIPPGSTNPKTPAKSTNRNGVAREGHPLIGAKPGSVWRGLSLDEVRRQFDMSLVVPGGDPRDSPPRTTAAADAEHLPAAAPDATRVLLSPGYNPFSAIERLGEPGHDRRVP